MPEVLASLAPQFDGRRQQLEALDRPLGVYQRALHATAGRSADDDPTSGALAAAQAGLIAAGTVPVVGALAAGIDLAAVARGAGGARGCARQQEDAGLLADPVRALTAVFVSELARIADTVPWIVLFCDTYERTAPLLDSWPACSRRGVTGSSPPTSSLFSRAVAGSTPAAGQPTAD